jgi:hypothetical protein
MNRFLRHSMSGSISEHFTTWEHPPAILIASPQALTQKGKKPHRIVVHADGTINQLTVDQLKEPEFQSKLATTIKELTERAAVLFPKHDNTPPPVDPAVP